jgi:hypothetical protein
MRRVEVASHEDLIAMVERIAAASRDKEALSLLELVRQDEGLARQLFERSFASEGLDLQVSSGFLDKLALSSLPFVAIDQLQESYPSLLRRLSIYSPSIGRVRLVVTPSMEFHAKMHLGADQSLCCLSLGLIVTVQCVALCLVCRDHEFTRRTTVREYLEHNSGLRLVPQATVRAYRDQFRSSDTHPFAEENPILGALGISANEVNELLLTASCEDFILANILSNEAIRFFLLHELAHFEHGHAQLYRMWIEHPDEAGRTLMSGFPVEDARRAMESIADGWAAEKLLVAAIFGDSSMLHDVLFGRKATPLQKTHIVIAAVEFAFILLGAVDTILSRRSALLQTLGDALSSKVRDMYPGFAARSSYAVPRALKYVARGYPYLRWTRWWRVRGELASFNDRAWGMFLLEAWHSAGLGGHLPVVTSRALQPTFTWFDSSPLRGTVLESESRGNDEVLQKIGFDYVRAHNDLLSDLQAAKTWWGAKE